MDANYGTAPPAATAVVDPFDRARMDRAAEATWWRRAWVGESTAFDRARAAQAPTEVEWSGPKLVAS